MTETPERLLTAIEAATLLGLSIKTLERHRGRGVGPHYIKLGAGRSGRVRYRRGDLEAWIARHRRASTASATASARIG
jgi:predicted DNA-binding transcriptional regulator AlpA